MRVSGYRFVGVLLAAALSCAMAKAEPKAASPHPVPGVEFVFEALVEIAPAQLPGATPMGGRSRVPITGGTFEGPRIKGKVLPGGADWQLRRADGTLTLDADYMIEADDGTLIHVLNHGIASGVPGTATEYLRTTPSFEAPIGPHDWLNKAVFVGTVELAPNGAVRIRVFRVT